MSQVTATSMQLADTSGIGYKVGGGCTWTAAVGLNPGRPRQLKPFENSSRVRTAPDIFYIGGGWVGRNSNE